MEEQELIQAIAEGDRRAAGRFITSYLPVILCAFRYKKIPEQDIDDLVQNFFAKLSEGNYRRLRSWRGDASLKTWLSVLARNFAIDWLRRRHTDQPLDEDMVQQSSQEEPDRLQWLRERRQLIDGILEHRLKARSSDLIRRHFFAEQTIAEISVELEMTENNVRVAIHRALAQLRQCLAGESQLQGET